MDLMAFFLNQGKILVETSSDTHAHVSIAWLSSAPDLAVLKPATIDNSYVKIGYFSL